LKRRFFARQARRQRPCAGQELPFELGKMARLILKTMKTMKMKGAYAEGL